MKIGLFAALLLIGILAGASSTNAILCSRMSIFDISDRPVLVAGHGPDGGELIVYDANGHEAFSIKGGKLQCDGFKEQVRQAVAELQKSKPQPSTQPQSQPVDATRDATGDPVDSQLPTPASLNAKLIKLYQPKMLGQSPVLRLELIGMIELETQYLQPKLRRWKVTVKITNIASYRIGGLVLEPMIDGNSNEPEGWSSSEISKNNYAMNGILGRAKADMWTFTIEAENKGDISNRLGVNIVHIESER